MIKLNKNLLSLGFIAILFLYACANKQVVKDEDGHIVEEYILNEEGNKEGEFKRFDEKGNVIEIANYINGKLDGEHKFFYPNGALEQIEHYSNDVIHGDWISYHVNGQIKLIYKYDNGVMNGHIKKYSDNGILLEIVQMKNNEENGPFKEYYENGKVKWEGEYLNGDKEFGLLKNYNENGVLLKKMMCDSLGICRTIWTKEKGDIILEPLNLNLKGINEDNSY